ncbi:hypothetical protein ACOME3_003749 [Neoechinorhynchus agilis]
MNKSIDEQWHRKSFQWIKVTDTKLGHACLNLTNGISVGISLDGCIRIKSLNNSILVAYRPSQTDPHSYSLKSKCINIFASTDAVKLALSTSNTGIFTIETCNEQKVNGDQSLENSVNLNWASKTVLIENLIGENKTWHSKTSASLWRFDKALRAFLETANKDDLATQKRLMKSVRIKKIRTENGEHFLQVQIFFERWIYTIRQNVSGIVIARMSSRATRMPFMSIKVDPSDTVFSISTEKLKVSTLKHQLTSYETHLCRRGCDTFNDISLNSELVCLTSKDTHFLITKPDNELRIYRMVFSCKSDQFKRTNAYSNTLNVLTNSVSECLKNVSDSDECAENQEISSDDLSSLEDKNEIEAITVKANDDKEINTGSTYTISSTEISEESFRIDCCDVNNVQLIEPEQIGSTRDLDLAEPIKVDQQLDKLQSKNHAVEIESDSGRGRSSWSSDDVYDGDVNEIDFEHRTVAELKYMFEFSKVFKEVTMNDEEIKRENLTNKSSNGHVFHMKKLFEHQQNEIWTRKCREGRKRGNFVRKMVQRFNLQ